MTGDGVRFVSGSKPSSAEKILRAGGFGRAMADVFTPMTKPWGYVERGDEALGLAKVSRASARLAHPKRLIDCFSLIPEVRVQVLHPRLLAEFSSFRIALAQSAPPPADSDASSPLLKPSTFWHGRRYRERCKSWSRKVTECANWRTHSSRRAHHVRIGSNTKAFTTAALATGGAASSPGTIRLSAPSGFVMYDPYVSHEMTIRDCSPPQRHGPGRRRSAVLAAVYLHARRNRLQAALHEARVQLPQPFRIRQPALHDGGADHSAVTGTSWTTTSASTSSRCSAWSTPTSATLASNPAMTMLSRILAWTEASSHSL